MSNNFKPWTDGYGLLGRLQTNTGKIDGGDSCHKTSHAEWLIRLNTDWSSLHPLNVLFSSTIPVRNPDPAMWYSNPNTTSRDQLKAFLLFLSIQKYPKILGRIFLQHLKYLCLFAFNTRRNWQYPTLEQHQAAQARGDIGQNVVWDYSWKVPDFCGPEMWAIYIRGFRCRILYPLLPVLDLETLIGVIIKFFHKKDVDCMNDLGVLYLSKICGGSPVMWLARKIAKRFLQARLVSYFTNEGEPPLHLLTAQVVKEL